VPWFVQGNCGADSQLSLLKDLQQSTAGRVEYPPLKPFQCVLVISKPLLWNNNATLWLDSLYLAITRTKVESDFSIIQYGNYLAPEGVPARSMYITSSTFVGEGRGSARAIATFEASAAFLIEGAKPVLRTDTCTLILSWTSPDACSACVRGSLRCLRYFMCASELFRRHF
jgi:hypothetical protein